MAMSGRQWFRRVGVVALVVGTALAGATVSSAHGGDTTKIHSCVRQTGALRIVGPADTCAGNETALDWIQNVTAGSGLTLSGTELSVDYGGTGTAQTAARSDHTHGLTVRYAQVAGGVTDSTTAPPSTPVDLPGTTIALSPSDVPGPSQLVITWAGRCYNSTAGSPFGVQTHVVVDDLMVAETHLSQPAPGDQTWIQHAANVVVSVLPGAHTVKVTWNVFGGGTGVAADRHLTVLVIPQG